MHRNPDPDSLGAAICMKFILSNKFGIHPTIFLEGEVSHLQNQTMVNILSIPLIKVEEYKKDEFDFVIILDTTTKNSFPDESILTIDHHRSGDSNAANSQIEEIGSTCTFMWEHMKALNLIELDEDQSIRTALVCGIVTDTNFLIEPTVTNRDQAAYQELVQNVDKKKLDTFLNYPLPTYYFDLERKVFEPDNFIEDDTFFIGGTGIISDARRDVIPMIADRLLRKQGIDTVFIFGIIGTSLVFSVRSKNSSLDVNTFCQKATNTKASGGGKQGMGGGRISLAGIYETTYPDELKAHFWTYVKGSMFHRVSSLLSGEL